MNKNFWLKKTALALLVCGLVVTAAAWKGQPGATKQVRTDTIPSKKIKDIDDALSELDKARTEMERSMKGKDWDQELKNALKDIDPDKIKAQLDKALEQIDAVKIQAEVEKAMKEVDMEKIKKDMEASMKGLDSEKIKAEVDKAMKSVDFNKIREDMNASLSQVDVEKIKAEIQRVKEIDFDKMREELKQMQPQLEKSMEQARESIAEAKKELTAYKNLIDGLESDGLLDKKQPYTIEYKKGELSVNGKKLSDQAVKKYQEFLKGRKNFTIKKDEDDFNIDND